VAPTTTLLGRTVDSLREASWSSLLQYSYVILIAGLLLKLATPAPLRSHMSRSLLVAPLLPFIAKELAQLPEFLLRLRAARAAGSLAGMLAALFPPEFLGLLQLEPALRRGFVARLCRRDAPPRPEGRVFGYLDRSSYSTVVAIVVLSALIELPLNGLILSLFIWDHATRWSVELALAATSLCALVWVLGDSWLVRGARHHVLTTTCLDLKVGARAQAKVALAAIAGCELLKETRLAWCKRNGVRLSDTALVSPFDKPNAVLLLRPGSGVSLTLNGMRRESPTCVFLYLDRPDTLVAALASQPASAR
jgi:hypothetical protein